MMALIGFGALLGLGLYLLVAGVVGGAAISAFGGKTPWQVTAFAVAGACMVALAVYNAPFTFVLKGGV